MHQIALTAYGSPKHDVALVQRICHVQDIFIREPLYGHALWDEIPQQAIVAFVLSPLPRAVRMCKVHLGAETLELCQGRVQFDPFGVRTKSWT